MPQKKKSVKKHSAVPPKKSVVASAAAIERAATPATPVASTPAAATSTAVATLAPAAAPVKVGLPTPAKAETTEIVAGMIRDLRHGDADVAREAATHLGQAADAAAVAPLIQVIANADNFYHSVVRAAAAASLGQLKDARAFEPLVVAINDPMAEASAEAVRALATLNDPRAVAPLVEVLRNRDGFFLSIVRRAAVFALAHLGGPEATAALELAAGDSWEDAVIRATAQDAVAGA